MFGVIDLYPLEDNYTYIFLGLYDTSNGTVIPYIILRCN